MTNRLSEKVCIISGTGRGNGARSGANLRARGALIVGCGLYVEDAEATVAAVRAAGGTMVSMQLCDLTKAADCQALVDFAVRSLKLVIRPDRGIINVLPWRSAVDQKRTNCEMRICGDDTNVGAVLPVHAC